MPDDSPPTPPPTPQPGPLAPFAGARPPAPAWFDAALAQAPERFMADADGVAIEVHAWGEPGRPGLLLLHGNGAHAGWWAPLAPLLAADGYRVAAASWSGMGGSGWRPAYALDLFADEMAAASAAAGLDRPIVIAHSFGGFAALHATARDPGRYRALMAVDSPVRPPGHPGGGPPRRHRPNPVYPALPDILARFRLAPPQDCANLWYVDHIARGSIRPADGGGFTWRFDPFVMNGMDIFNRTDLLERVPIPLAVVYGARSALMAHGVIEHMHATAPAGTPFRAIADADHHVMLDQPLPFVAAIRDLLAGWPA
jgi:pimeloyl-ACP methyl ester carboxylesterase